MSAHNLFLLIGSMLFVVLIGGCLLIPAIAHDPAQMAQPCRQR